MIPNSQHSAQLTGLELIAAEHRRQLAKGYDADHDDFHHNGIIAEVVEQLLHRVVSPHSQPQRIGDLDHDYDQWHVHILKKWGRDPDRLLVIAGALIVAEIERRQRAGMGGDHG